MLAGRTERRDVPHAPGEWIEFKTLSGLQMQRARDADTERSTKNYVGLIKGLDPATIQAIREQEQREQKNKTEKAPDYDAEMLIKWGVNAWSEDIPCTDENKVLLDGQTLQWAFEQIVEMNTLPLASAESNSPGENSHSASAMPISSSSTE